MTVRHLGSVGTLVAAIVLATGCGREERRAANLVVIGIDTLRADHLGCYGYGRPTSPRLDALAGEGVTFETAISQAPWTLPAFASMFTGLLPSHHRAGEGTLPYVSRLDDQHPTLAGVLQARGFRTAAFVSNVWVGRDVGLDRGFATHELHTTPQQALDGAVAWLAEQDAGRFFLFVHLFDPHAPYAPPPEHAKEFVAPDYTGPFEKVFPTVWQHGAPVMTVDPNWTAADRQRIVDLYDAEIHYADALVGRLLDALASRGVLDDTLVAVVSDHGEELFDHGDLDHGHTLYDELLRVPLILRFPGGRGPVRVAAQVRTMDLFPTALETLGLAVPDGIDAESLLPVVRGDAQTPTAAVGLAEFVVHGPDPNAKALRLAGEKLIVAPTKNTVEYFDLAADPREQRNVVGDHADRVRSLRIEVERHLLTSVDGFHLFAVGQKDHRLELTLASDDGFLELATLHGEDGDRATIAPDGRTLTITLALRPQDSPVRPHDLDGVRFRTRGPGPLRVTTLALDGGPMPPMVLALGRSPIEIPPRPDETIPRERLRVTHPARPKPRPNADVTVVLQYVETPARAAAELSPDVVERLRALGYVP